ncbi:MAG: glycosyltransferase family 29 protein [FCB group bacterium]|nr:glycosyltransferase family 29 protein [FCB group bacterium]MBL7120530.1 glycosyltransferase family 29 protein [Candidatus Neomarinimicrobiota bacterium]
MSKKTIIIGNGPSAAGHALGKEIDDFEQIIRINNYVTHNMETHVGSRTDIWVNGANQGLKRRSDIPENILVMIPPVVLKHKGDTIHPRITKRLGTKNYALLPIEIMSEMESSCGLDRPTTGFFAIYFFYLLGLDLTLHGFDFFVGSTAHYFDSPLKRWLKEKGLIRKAGKHDVSGEKEFVESLIGQEKIKLLTG